MKAKITLPLLALLLLGLTLRAQPPAAPPATEPPKDARATTADTPKPAVADPEARFQALLTKASLTGRWAPLRDGVLGDERGGDSYQIEGVTKITGENWVVRAKLRYRQREFVLPIPVKVRFVGDTAILILDGLAIPEGGTYSARVMFHDHTYSGSWTGGRGGGMLYGVLTNEKE
jgi:hypothetical protein